MPDHAPGDPQDGQSPEGDDPIHEPDVPAPETAPDVPPEAAPSPRQFGAACESNADCDSAYCIEAWTAYVCTRPCTGECPDGWACRTARIGSEPLDLCAPAGADLCKPCEADQECSAGACIDVGGVRSCGRDCPESPCPPGYACVQTAGTAGGEAGGEADGQCVPASGACDCTTVSDGRKRACTRTNDAGTCTGFETCDREAGWLGCTAPEAAPETCNGLDDDCDGDADEAFPERGKPCVAGKGACTRFGVLACNDDGDGLACDAAAGEPSVESCNGLDDDCDGAIDQPFPGKGKPCSAGKGACTRYGVLACDEAGAGLACDAAAGEPSAERCNGLDDDCDGATDQPFPGKGKPCSAGKGACTRYGVLACDEAGAGLACDAVAGEPSAERCNGLDDDCDGAIDQAFPDKGKACVAGTGACTRFGVIACDDAGDGVACLAEPGDPAAEACNYQDDDCDGDTDEDFVADGVYVRDEACGNCFTDCTRFWTADEHHARGRCEVEAGAARCRYACDGGWADADGRSDNGCELWIDPDALFVSVPEDGGEDTAACGAFDDPCASVGRGIARAIEEGRSRVLVSDGIYPEDVTLVGGVSLLGGHAAASWVRDPAVNRTILSGTATPGSGSPHRRAVTASGITAPTELSGFTIWGENVFGHAAGKAGGNSYAVWAVDSSDALVIADNVIYGGRGGAGGAGRNGASGGNGAPGAAGATGRDEPHACARMNPGGAGGASACGVAGGDGAWVRCPSANTQQPAGLPGKGGAGAGEGGMGGWDAYVSGVYQGQPNCNIATLFGHQPSALDGTDGGPGASGAGGGGCEVPAGSVAGGDWTPAGASPGSGGGGGKSGGGGGAGGSVQVVAACNTVDTLGGGGGGGGAAGCGGAGGEAGLGGGGSFAVFVARTTTGPQTAPAVTGNTIVRNGGGDGGAGGNGGQGGVGGPGAQGGNTAGTYKWASGKGGYGGAGGSGGHGGGGGGGCGGPSWGLYGSGFGGEGGPAADWCSAGAANAFSAVAGPGAGGPGGASNGEPGATGRDGSAADCVVLQ
ncbi:MAG: hypothetical protein FJ087_09525 [Deltaproteobacteria bacterium]|nr:hypothetical protein [Deltaproteobacteria bacterium]